MAKKQVYDSVTGSYQEVDQPEMPGMVHAMGAGMAQPPAPQPARPKNWDTRTQSERYDWEQQQGLPGRVWKDPTYGDMGEAGWGMVDGGGWEGRADAIAAPSQTQRQQDQRLGYARDFREQMPNLAQEMGGELKRQAAQGLSAANRGTQEQMSSRGLLHSNINRGAQAGNRARAQAGLASGIAGINQGLSDAASQLDAQAVESGMAIQQTQQQIEDGIYSQAMAKMAGNNNIMGSAIGLAATAGLLYATGGIASPWVAGGVAGGALGAGMLSQR